MSLYEFAKYEIKSPNQIPEDRHYQILVYETNTIHHEGDERSRQCPSHGYPAYTETINIIRQFVFTSLTEFENMMAKLSESTQRFKGMSVTPARITKRVSVSIDVAQ